jgi:serine/threonine-protein kinase RsbW
MDPSENVLLKKSTGKLQITTPVDGAYIKHIVSMVADLARQVGFADVELEKIKMAVGEACSNVVEHAYAPGQKKFLEQRNPEIRLDLRREKDCLIIEINDHGQRFDFSNYRPTDLDDSIASGATGGFGIPIMRLFMDEVQYSSNDKTGNTLRLVKYLKKT